MKREDLPDRGIVFWPVGNGDSVTVLVGDDLRTGHDVVLQIDLNDMAQAEDDDDPHVCVIDELEELLPEVDGRPYLSVFVLTHPDQDHCRGFADLQERVTIGELWFTPRVFREQDDLCEDAEAFREEAHRRRDAVIDAGAGSILEVEPGDRIRVVGYDELFEEDEYASLPVIFRSVPGDRITTFDGYDYAATAEAFLHAPFRSDAEGERNNTSLAIQVALEGSECVQRTLLLGDLSQVTLERIFDCSEDPETVAWDVLLAPHHCSRRALFDDEGKLNENLFEAVSTAANEGAWVVASSREFPSTDTDGADPPHLIVRGKYEEIVADQHFLVTAEHGDVSSPDPIVFAVEEGDCGYRKPPAREAAASALSAASIKARAASPRPHTRGRYGRAG